MLVQCPKCRSKHRVTELGLNDRVITYYCQACMRIVKIDLLKDEVKHSSSATHFERIWARKKILVVDDRETILEIVEALLEPTGCEIVFAKDGLDALRIIKQQHPDLVILDLLLPKMTGLDVLREIRRAAYSKETPVLVMSGVLKRTNEIMALNRLGANGFITKDALAENLLYRVSTILEMPQVYTNH
ncbi:PleD family two-component system response regulator [Acidobacteriota bacterium]